MTKTIMTIHWLPMAAVAAPVPLLWLMVVSPINRALAMILLIVASSILAGALRIGWSRKTRSMADAVHDAQTAAPPIAVRATSAVSAPRQDRGRA